MLLTFFSAVGKNQKKLQFRKDLKDSDVPILGLRPRTARTEVFLGGPRLYKDRSSKTERPAVFFGP